MGRGRGKGGPLGLWIRANRSKLRVWLSTGLDIKWGKKCVDFEVRDGGGVKVIFEDGTAAEGDVLVGADGTNSSGITSPPWPHFIY